MTASPLLPTSSHCEECRVAAEALEPRIAPAGFSATFLTILPTLHGPALAVPDASLAAVSATAQAPVIFSTEHAGVILKDEVTIFATEAYKGTIESIAVRRTSTTDAVNLPIGGLDFYFQVALTSGAPNAEVSTVTLGLFAPYLVAAGIDGRSGPIVSTDPLNGKTGGGETPVLFSYSAGVGRYDFSAAGLDEKLTLDHPLSAWMVLRTSAHSFHAAGSAGLIGTLSTTTSILAPTTDSLLVTGAGTGSLVRVFDRTTGAVKESFDAFSPRHRYGVRVATGDVNGDGVDDIIVGSGRGSVGGARVRVFDGANTNHPPLLGVLGDFKPFGSGFLGALNVAAADVNGDGRDDVIVAPASGSSGQVRIFSGLDGSLLSRFTALSRVTGGVRIAAGDVNGDGLSEVIVGAGIGSGVKVFNGLTGMPLAGMNFQAFETGYRGGVTVAAGDVDGDGIDELVVGSAHGLNLVRIFDHTLTKLAEFQTSARLGVRVATADVNGDGLADIVAGKGPGENAAVSIYDGVTRAKILDLSGYNPAGTAGVFVG